MKAISKFKSLLSAKGAVSKPYQPLPERTRESDTRQQTADEAYEDFRVKETEESTAEHAACVLKDREQFLHKTATATAAVAAATPNSRSRPGSATPGEKGHAHDPTDVEPLFLGIGTGGRDDLFPPQTPVRGIVSDSPTGVDFNVYDRAFEAEVQRIKRTQSGRRGSAAMYATRHLQDKEQFRTDQSLAWVEGGGPRRPQAVQVPRDLMVRDDGVE
jgi:[calcium/calmodulin-dependent protein kinase] kinase